MNLVTGGNDMTAVLSELLTYLFKFVVMLVCAFCGILVGKKIRANKDLKEPAIAKESKE